ncbi:hypothetical protein VTK73DRAFT_1704 [Phialemonium thermophilum]|uniref:EKC/KEOPS complex subunit BUD32 n=1 Tax=Phialemonium thermophilum TaxID=223376 RepID=A0ABR3X8H0_9PEZI
MWRLRTFNRLPRRTRPALRFISNRGPIVLPAEVPVEEETLPSYEPDEYYPVHIGDVFNSRYRVVGKLGYGLYSTSWLCHDKGDNEYVAVKVSTSLRNVPAATHREVEIYAHLAQTDLSHPGCGLIRALYDTFELDGPVGTHQCLVLQPMHTSLSEIMRSNSKPFKLPLIKVILERLLCALDFLHTSAHVTHTDITIDNIMLSVEDETMFADFEEAERTNPSPRKVVDSSRTIYRSRRFRPPASWENCGLPVLCDFGEARVGTTQETGPFVQPHVYRAPEIIFEMPWGSAVDIWNVACLTWDLFERQRLFKGIFDAKGNYDPYKHSALMVALLGSPPSDFVRRSTTTEQCFDPRGGWVAGEKAAVPDVSLDSLEKRLSGQEKYDFLRFMRSMLRWLPEERITAKDLLEDPWLK